MTRSGRTVKRLVLNDAATAKTLGLALKSVMRSGELDEGEARFLADHAETVTSLWLQVLPLRDALFAAEMAGLPHGAAMAAVLRAEG